MIVVSCAERARKKQVRRRRVERRAKREGEVSVIANHNSQQWREPVDFEL